MIKIKNNNKGFTLAEVLITLVIIGVIAAMTIPTLINKTNNQDFVGKFKKNYSVISNAINAAQSENGLLTYWDWSDRASGFANIENFILPHLQVAENCKNTTTCTPDYNWKKLNGNDWFNFKTNTSQYKVVLNDGSAVVFYPVPSCTENYKPCIEIHADTNGSKGPNREGRDIFSYYVYPYTNDIVAGGVRTSYDISSNTWNLRDKSEIDTDCSTGAGFYCGAKIILEGYKMNY